MENNGSRYTWLEMDAMMSCRIGRRERVGNKRSEFKYNTSRNRNITTYLIWSCAMNDGGQTTEQVLKWIPRGRKRRGRPRKSWSTGIQEAMQETWMKTNAKTE